MATIPVGDRPVPIAWVQDALDQLVRDGEITINVDTVRYRSAFVGAVPATLPREDVAAAGDGSAHARQSIGGGAT